MFVWLSYYSKSVSTFVRSLLSSYFFSEDGNFNFSMLKNILQFPNKSIFEKVDNGITIYRGICASLLITGSLLRKKIDIY